jgi:hypothetical protein
MEDKKAIFELHKIYLNHIFILIIGLGSGSFGLLLSKENNEIATILGIIGLVITAISIWSYVTIAKEANNKAKDIR